ncbi:MAG: hypothetical protein IKG85_06210 [Clostridia bacterium]|nr:hypothetical protein [Clostridia bacterium]
MKKTTKLLSVVLAVLLIASVMPLPAFAAPERFDAVAGATGGGGGDDDDDTPSSFGNSPGT